MSQPRIPTDKEIAEKARNLILTDLSRNYSIQSLAEETGVTAYGLKRIFKKVYGITVSGFSRQARMNKAKELLTDSNNTLQMIAEELGYTEGNNFQQTFKKVTGMTPGEWRRKKDI